MVSFLETYMKVKKHEEALAELGEEGQRLVRSIAVAMRHPDPDHFVDCVKAAHVNEERPLAAGEEVAEAAVEEVAVETEKTEG